MIKNYTETTREFKTGFFLNEQELRRLIEVIQNQFDKIHQSHTHFNYITKIINGLVVESNSLEYVLKSENIGVSQISELIIKAHNVNSEDTIEITFNTLINRIYDNVSIEYSIKSTNRDWALISSTLIDDRLNKISKSSLLLFITKRLGLLVMCLAIIGMTTFLIYYISFSEQSTKGTLDVLNSLENKINKKQNLDILKSIIEIEKTKLTKDNFSFSGSGFKYFFLLMTIPMFFSLFSDNIKLILNKYFPFRVMYWGDYINSYDKMVKRRNIVLGFIFITIVVSVAINLLSNVIWNEITN